MTDDPALRIETSMSRAGILFSMGRTEEAFLEWEAAGEEARAFNQNELAALCRVYFIRARLTILDNEGSSLVDVYRESLENLVIGYKSTLERDANIFARNSHSIAAHYVTMGLAEKILGNWSTAENYAAMALSIHERGNFLEDAAYDWFLIGSIRSGAGNYEGALEALNRAIEFDRRAENSFGLASSWQAVGDVESRLGRIPQSNAAWIRAAEIFRAMGLLDRAQRLELRITGSAYNE